MHIFTISTESSLLPHCTSHLQPSPLTAVMQERPAQRARHGPPTDSLSQPTPTLPCSSSALPLLAGVQLFLLLHYSLIIESLYSRPLHVLASSAEQN